VITTGGCRRLWSALLVVLLAIPVPRSGAGEIRAVVGLERDSNLFEDATRPRAGWISRFYVSSTGSLLRTKSGYISLRYKGGVKRYWRAASAVMGLGDVVANDVELRGLARLNPRFHLGGAGALKIKQVHQVPGEEGYLKGAIAASVRSIISTRFTGVIRARIGADDSRDITLPETVVKGIGFTGIYGKNRNFTTRVGVTWNWMDYDRRALSKERLSYPRYSIRRMYRGLFYWNLNCTKVLLFSLHTRISTIPQTVLGMTSARTGFNSCWLAISQVVWTGNHSSIFSFASTKIRLAPIWADRRRWMSSSKPSSVSNSLNS